MDTSQVEELLYQALETERGSIKMYRSAMRCVEHPELQAEWQRQLETAESHERTVRQICESLGLDPEKDTIRRQIVRHRGLAMVNAMEMALTGSRDYEPIPMPPPLAPEELRPVAALDDRWVEELEGEELALTR